MFYCNDGIFYYLFKGQVEAKVITLRENQTSICNI